MDNDQDNGISKVSTKGEGQEGGAVVAETVLSKRGRGGTGMYVCVYLRHF